MSTKSTMKLFADDDSDCAVHIYEELLANSEKTRYRIEVDGVYESFDIAIPKALAENICKGRDWKSE